MKICYEAIKAGVKLLPTSFLYAVGREDNSRNFVLKCLPEPITTTLSEKTLISRGGGESLKSDMFSFLSFEGVLLLTFGLWTFWKELVELN
mgnify:CR=1 FL=1